VYSSSSQGEGKNISVIPEEAIGMTISLQAKIDQPLISRPPDVSFVTFKQVGYSSV